MISAGVSTLNSGRNIGEIDMRAERNFVMHFLSLSSYLVAVIVFL